MKTLTIRHNKRENTIKFKNKPKNKKKSSHIVKKGGDSVKDEIEDIDKKLQLMKDNRTVYIKDLENNISEVFKELVNYITKSYEVPSKYSELYKKIEKVFSDVKEESIYPGTVLSYFIGCIVTSSIVPSSCSALCAGSVPRPDDIDNPICDYTVYIATLNKDQNFIFTAMNHTDNKQDVIIYVTFDTITEFPGISASEKKALSSKGVEMINLISFDPKSNEYNELTTGFLPINDIKLRIDSKEDEKSQNTSNTMGYYVGIVLLILLSVVVLAIFLLVIFKDKLKKKT